MKISSKEKGVVYPLGNVLPLHLRPSGRSASPRCRKTWGDHSQHIMRSGSCGRDVAAFFFLVKNIPDVDQIAVCTKREGEEER